MQPDVLTHVFCICEQSDGMYPVLSYVTFKVIEETAMVAFVNVATRCGGCILICCRIAACLASWTKQTFCNWAFLSFTSNVCTLSDISASFRVCIPPQRDGVLPGGAAGVVRVVVGIEGRSSCWYECV